MSFESQLPILTALVPDSVYASGILSVKFKALTGRVVFFRPFISRKSSNGLFVERVIAVFPNGELHLFDADARPKRGVNLALVSSLVHEGSTVVLIFDGRSSEQEDLQLRFDSGPGELQRQSSVTTRVQIRVPTTSASGSSSAEEQAVRASLATPKQFVSVVSHFSPSVAKLYDVPIDDLELDLQKPANFVRPVNMVASSAPLPLFSKRQPNFDGNPVEESGNISGKKAGMMNEDTVSRSSVDADGLRGGQSDDPFQRDDADYDSRQMDDMQQQQQQSRVAFRDLAPQSESFTLDALPDVPENVSVNDLHMQNILMFGELKGLLNGMEKSQAPMPLPADDEEYHPQLHSTMSSVQYRQALADRLREHRNREAFMERQRSISAGEDGRSGLDGSQGRRGGGSAIVDFERLFLGEAKAVAAANTGGPDHASPEKVLARLRAKHTELKVQNLMLQGELRGLGLVVKNSERDHILPDHRLDPSADNVFLYHEMQQQQQYGQSTPSVKLIPTKQYQRAINLSVLILNICRKRRQAVLQAVRQSRIEEERRMLEGQYFVSTGLPLSMMTK